MNRLLRASRRLFGNSFVLGGLASVTVGLLHLFGLLLPTIRFTITLALAIAMIVTVFAVYRLILASLKASDDSTASDAPKFKVVSLACGASVLVCSLALALLPAADKAPENRGTQSRNLGTAPSQSVPKGDSGANEAAEFLGTLFQAQIEADQRAQTDPRYLEFQRSLQQMSVCSRCGGQGNYRYVDPSGMLQMRICPSCRGSGKSY